MLMTFRSLSFCVITFMLKYLKSSYFSNKMMDLVNIWYDVRKESKLSKFPSVYLSFCVITFMLKYLKSSYFSNKMMDLVNIWYDVRKQSKVSKFPSVYLYIHLFIRPSTAIRGADFP